ncbi:glycosyltransferase [Streptomyces sp. NBC_00237]|uniref:glycosyltransferase n=1 Tax=Streptomyces sp. NBC_00237 TaxID=2975687 RepID=UPI0022534B84|nr:glycosyltransferase [Streptomyces sp. NBC_00237]MCX5200108.1 glycosyltransferase [Streptomyces sp. NBC_00237]
MARSRLFGVGAGVLTGLAAAQQVMLAVGLGGWLPGWQPWPCLLLAAVLWLLAKPWWSENGPGAEGVPGLWTAAEKWLRRVPVWAYVVVVLVVTAAVWAWLQDFEPYLGHEEAVYANKARFWFDGTPDAGWGVYRPVGLPALGAIALWVTGYDGYASGGGMGALRAVTLVLALLMLCTTYLVARAWTTPRRALVAVLVLLSGLGFLRRMPEYLNDIGSTALLLIVVFLLVRSLEQAGTKAGARALWLAPLVVLAAFYMRYGVVGNLLAVALAGVFAYGPRAWWALGWRLWAAVGVLVVGLVPHFVYATERTGKPLGMILSATSQANREYVGDGFVYYLSVFPYRLAGDLGAVVMTAGVCAAFAAWRRVRKGGAAASGVRADDRRRVFLGASALLVFVVLGVATDGEPRFVYLPVTLLTVLGVQAVAELTRAWAPRVLMCVGALAAVTVLGTTQVVAHGAMPGPTKLGVSTVPVARALAAEDGERCLIVTGYEPEFGWYSGCDAMTYRQYEEKYAGERAAQVPKGTRVSFVRFAKGRLQPGAAGVRKLIDGRPATPLRMPAVEGGSAGAATVWSVRF